MAKYQKDVNKQSICIYLHTFVFLMNTSAYQADELHIVNDGNQHQGDPLYSHYIPMVTQPLSGLYQRPLLQVPLLNAVVSRGMFYLDMSGVICTFRIYYYYNWRLSNYKYYPLQMLYLYRMLIIRIVEIYNFVRLHQHLYYMDIIS